MAKYQDNAKCPNCGKHTWDKGENNTIDTRYDNGGFDQTNRSFYACGCIKVQQVYADGTKSPIEWYRK